MFGWLFSHACGHSARTHTHSPPTMTTTTEGGSSSTRSSALRFVWAAAVVLRIAAVFIDLPSLIGHRFEIVTPITSTKRLAEGYWLKQVGNSPYAGSIYHGSPLLLSVLGPIAGRTGGKAFALSFIFVCADCAVAFFLVKLGKRMQCAQSKLYSSLCLSCPGPMTDSRVVTVGDIAATVYLWNPFTIVSCIGGCTSSIENAVVILSLYGAVLGNVPLATFGWVMATHFSLYPAILIIPITLIMAIGIDHPPYKLFKGVTPKLDARYTPELPSDETQICKGSYIEDFSLSFKTNIVRDVIVWSALWWGYVLCLCMISLRRTDGIRTMFSKTYGFILNVDDLSPNLGLFWYFFTEVFDFFRTFFLLVFHGNILFMIIPLTIRLHHRPMFLAFIFCCITAMLKSYPSLGDAALYLGLLPLFMNELSGMRFAFFLLYAYIGIALLSPVMLNLWIWRGTGNANFYFATALSYACLQLIMIVESVSTILLFDRKIGKLKGFHIIK